MQLHHAPEQILALQPRWYSTFLEGEQAEIHSKCRSHWRRGCCHAQVLLVAWLIATTFFLICYASPCAKLPPKAQLQYFELGGDDQDIFAGVDDTDARGLKHFPRLWWAQ